MVMRCIAPPLQHLALDIATAMRVVQSSGEAFLKEIKITGGEEEDEEDEEEGERRRRGVGLKKGVSVVERVVRGVKKVCDYGVPLPAATFGAVFPVSGRLDGGFLDIY